jgi:hypothetical protein
VISADAMTFVQAIKTGDASNQLEANCSGQSLSLSVNGQAAVQASDSDFTSGEVGLITGSYDEPGVDILFDNFSVHKE